MLTTRRKVLLGSASAALAGSALPNMAKAAAPLDAGNEQTSRKALVRMIKVMFPHKRFADGPYERTADAVIKAASKTPSEKVDFAAALGELSESGFADLDDKAALARLKGMESTAFFKLVKGTTVTTLYDDPEVWQALGYEGPSFDKGGYINRGFNDLNWLPDPRVEEFAGGSQ
jgi:hypothetical protein